MTWSTDFFNDATYMTTTGNISGGMLTYYDRKFLETVHENLRIAPLAQSKPLPENSGKTIQFYRYNPIAVSVSGAALTEGKNPNATLVTGQNLSATIYEYGDFSQHSSIISRTHIDAKLAGVTELWGYNSAETIDNLCQMALAANGAYPIRAATSTSGTHHYSGTVDSATTTTVVDTDVESLATGNADDEWNQAVIVITSGTGYGQARPVTDYAVGTGTFTVAPAWDVTPAAGDKYHVVSAHSISATDVLTTAYIRSAVATLRQNKAQPFNGGYYVGILCPETEKGLMSDTTWTAVMEYRDRPEIKVNGLFAGEVGEWGGVRWIRHTLPYRFPIAALGTAGYTYGVGPFDPANALYTNYSSSGSVYATFILGKNAFGVSTLGGENYLKPGIIIKQSGPQDTSNPLNRFSTVGYALPIAVKGLNPMFAVQMWSGA